jgi:hypothetical protein
MFDVEHGDDEEDEEDEEDEADDQASAKTP